MFDYLFIDLDGPILETKFRHYWVFKEALYIHNNDTNLEIDTFWNLKRNKVVLSKILELNGSTNINIQELNLTILNLMESVQALDKDILKVGAVEFLIRSRCHFKNIFLVTMRRNELNTNNQLDKLGIISYFDSILIANNSNPNPKYEVIKNLIFKKALFIGDTEEDSITAYKLGIKSVGILNGIREKELMNFDFYFEELINVDLSLLLEGFK